MKMAFLDRQHVRAVLQAIRHSDGLRFKDVAARTGLLDPQVDRALQQLKAHDIIWARTIPSEGRRLQVEYVLTPVGVQLGQGFDQLHQALDQATLPADLREALHAWLEPPQFTAIQGTMD